jgi:lysophospholipase L1-like esterase
VRPREHTLVAALAATLACRPEPGEARDAPPEPPRPSDPSAPPPPRPDGPVLPPAVRAARDTAQRAILRDDALLPDLPVLRPGVDPAPVPGDLPGWFVPIETAPDTAPLARLHAALAALAAGEDPDGKVRLAFYGASGTASDMWTGYVRAYLHARFGDGGAGFVSPIKHRPWYRHGRFEIESSARGWAKDHAQMPEPGADGRWGLMGVAMTSERRGVWGEIVPRDGAPPASYEIWFLRRPDGGRFEVTLDGRRVGTVDTRADEPGPGYYGVPAPEGERRLRLRVLGDAPVTIFGVVAESAAPGVVVDTLGIDGARAANHLAWDEALWLEQIRRRDPVLYVLAYGTNEAVDDDQPMEAYREDLRRVLERFRRALPDASCLMLGPGDFPLRQGEQLLVRPRIDQIIAVQRALAPEFGCGYWDGLSFMGGTGSMRAWVEAEPPLARDDHLHFNGRGQVRMGMAIADAIMLDYDWARR